MVLQHDRGHQFFLLFLLLSYLTRFHIFMKIALSPRKLILRAGSIGDGPGGRLKFAFCCLLSFSKPIRIMQKTVLFAEKGQTVRVAGLKSRIFRIYRILIIYHAFCPGAFYGDVFSFYLNRRRRCLRPFVMYLARQFLEHLTFDFDNLLPGDFFCRNFYGCCGWIDWMEEE